MKWFFRLGAGVLLALGLVAPAFAAITDGKSASTALPIGAPGQAVTGTVTGSNAGAFAYYTFNYPGDESESMISMSFSPIDRPTANSIGVNVYQGSTLLATMNGFGATPGSNSVTFSSDQAGPILVQVYNYQQDAPVTFQLQMSGAAPKAAAAVAPVQASTEAGSVDNPIPLTRPTEATLAGREAGSYVYYVLSYPGDNSTRTIACNFWPNGPHVANAVFVNVYQDGKLVTSGHGLDTDPLGQMKITFDTDSASPVLVQLANFSPDTTIGYSIDYQK